MLFQSAAETLPPLGAIISHTPSWVWGLLAALVWLGMSQTLPRTVGARRVLLLPIAMTALSLWGTATAFGRSPVLDGVLLAWAITAIIAFVLVGRSAAPAGSHYDAVRQRFHVPGSFWPLALILGIFVLRYAVNVALAIQPGMAQDPAFGLTVGALYGVCCGTIAGRAARLWRLAFDAHALALPAPMRRLIGGDPW